MAGDPLHLALVPLSLGDRFILVDARRVHPALDFGFWLIPAPAQLSRAELMATFLDGRNVAITPAGYRLNGVRMIADFSPPVGISPVTPQACSLGGLQCATYNLAALSRLPGFCAAYAGPPTSATTTVPRGHLAHGVSTTTTTSGPPPVDRAALLRARPDVRGSFIMSLDGKMIRFHVVGPSGHVEIAATVRDVTVEAVMTQLCIQLLDANELLPGLHFQACDRIVSDTDWGFSVFLCCRPGDHAGLAWIDARPMGLPPFSVALPFVLDERSLQAACGVDIPFDACIAVCGIPWHGTPRALRHCDVVSIRANFHQLFTLPLAALNSRVAGFATMLVQQRGPDHAPTTRCFTVDSICANWQLVHLSSSLALSAEDVYQKCILVAADFPPFPVSIGARVSPVETEVNCWYQTWLKPMFGDRFWRSTGLVFGEYTVFSDGAICEGPQRPWIVCIGEDIDVIIAGPGGEGLEDWPAPEGWVARPIATVGLIGQAALQRSSGAASGLLHFDLPEGGEPLAASTSAADNYDRLNDPFLPSWSSISEDDEVVWVSWSAPPLDDAEATEDTVSSSVSAGVLTIVDSDPEHAAAMSLLQIRAAPVSVVDKSSRQSAAVAPFSVPTPCGRACLPMPARDPPCPHSGTLSLSVLLQDSVQSTGDSDVDNLTGLVQCARLPWCDFWSLDLHSIPLPEHVRVFLQSAPVPSGLPLELWVFTDGSADHGAGWGALLFGVFGTPDLPRWCFLGWAGGRHRDSGERSTNNVAEGMAMRAVVTWALSLPPFVPLCICCDSQLVLGGVSGSTKPPCQSPLQGVNAHARCVQQLHESLGSAISFLWTPGHVGISGNECADAVAAAFSSCSHLPDSKIPAAVERLWAHPLLPWAWATVRQYDLPALSTLATAAYEPPEIPSQRNIQSVLDDVAAAPGPSEGFSFKLCTANVCSLRGKHHLLRVQLEGEQVAVCGIQETRSPSDSSFVSGNWLCFHSAAVRGHYGCALWLDRCRLRSLGGSLASQMSKEHCCVLDARPDWLAVRVTWGVLDSVFVVLHAPHTGHSPDARTEWWKRAGRDLRGYAKSAPLVLLGDFNAEPSCFDKPGIGQLALEVPDLSGELAAPVINDLGLVLVNTFPSAACPHTYAPTWRHKMIDFIGVPLRWQQGATQVRTCLDLGTSHDDHNAVVIKLCLPVSKKPPPKKPRPGVKTCAAAAYAPGVRMPWHCGVHEHAEKLFSVAKRCKPLAPPV